VGQRLRVLVEVDVIGIVSQCAPCAALEGRKGGGKTFGTGSTCTTEAPPQEEVTRGPEGLNSGIGQGVLPASDDVGTCAINRANQTNARPIFAERHPPSSCFPFSSPPPPLSPLPSSIPRARPQALPVWALLLVAVRVLAPVALSLVEAGAAGGQRAYFLGCVVRELREVLE